MKKYQIIFIAEHNSHLCQDTIESYLNIKGLFYIVKVNALGNVVLNVIVNASYELADILKEISSYDIHSLSINRIVPLHTYSNFVLD